MVGHLSWLRMLSTNISNSICWFLSKKQFYALKLRHQPPPNPKSSCCHATHPAHRTSGSKWMTSTKRRLTALCWDFCKSLGLTTEKMQLEWKKLASSCIVGTQCMVQGSTAKNWFMCHSSSDLAFMRPWSMHCVDSHSAAQHSALFLVWMKSG